MNPTNERQISKRNVKENQQMEQQGQSTSQMEKDANRSFLANFSFSFFSFVVEVVKDVVIVYSIVKLGKLLVDFFFDL